MFFCPSFLNICSHSDSADQNATRTSRRSVTQEKPDGPRHSERHQERSWQWWVGYLWSNISVIHLFYCYLSNKHALFQDNALEFEKRRNIPVKYNRNLWDKTGNVELYFSHLQYTCCENVLSFYFWTEESFVTFNLYSGSNEEGGRNKTETPGKVYHEQVSELFCVHSWVYLLSSVFCIVRQPFNVKQFFYNHGFDSVWLTFYCFCLHFLD